VEFYRKNHDRETVITTRFLLACLGVGPGNQFETYTAAEMGQIDWARLLHQSLQHRLLPLVQLSLRSCSRTDIPEDFRRQVNEYSDESKRSSLRLTFALLKVLDALAAQGVAVIPYKGPVLGALAYGAVHLRSFDDLDILVRPEDYLKPIDILAADGYITLPYEVLSPGHEAWFREYFGEYPLGHPNGNICIDVHSRLLGNGNLTLRTNFDAMWQRLQPVTIAGRTLQTLAVEDLLLYLCMNGFKDGWDSIRHVCDVAHLIYNQPNLSWQSVLSEAVALRLERPVALGILLAHELLKAPLPDAVLQTLCADRVVYRLAQRLSSSFIDELETGKGRSSVSAFWMKWVALRYWPQRLYYCWGMIDRVVRMFFIVNYRDAEFIQLPRSLYFLYYFIRPIRMVCHYRTNLFKLMFR
jgi:hypothetical protein